MTQVANLVATRGFLFGHYDSRGGTSFVPCEDRQEAERRYDDCMYGGELARMVESGEYGSTTLSQHLEEMGDYLGTAVVYSRETLPGATDLEECGRVIFKGPHQEWPEGGPSFQNGFGRQRVLEHVRDQLVDNYFQDVELEFVKDGEEPIKFAEGWNVTRWDDDSLAFYTILEG